MYVITYKLIHNNNNNINSYILDNGRLREAKREEPVEATAYVDPVYDYLLQNIVYAIFYSFSLFDFLF